MFGKVLSFCTRRDGAFKRKAARRLGSSRASVYLEYALVLPLTVLIISAMIEFAAFWDAKIMANHAAWTCARIATVEAGQKNYTKDGREPVVVTRGMKTATILLMSTCSMGSMHGTASDFWKTWVEDMIRTPLMKLQAALMNKLKEKLQAALKKILGKFLGDDAISKIVKEFLNVITKHLFTPLIDEIAKGIAGLFKPMFDALGQVLDGNRQLRQLAYAARRLNEFPNALTVVERDKSPFIFAKEGDIGQIGDSRLDFPRILDATVNNDSWFVSNDAPWPPNNQWQRMIDVKISWPFERAWMFPVLSQWKSPDKGGKGDKDPLKGMPTAVGRAMAYPQPIIKNDNLKSKGAEPYAPGKEMELPDIVKKIKDKYIGFLKVAALYYHYQLTTEETGPFDSCSSGSGSYKGLGLPSKYADKKKIYKPDGLVAWMDRLPEKPGDGKQWEKKKPPSDYLRSWKEITEAKNEYPLFWHGIPFFALTAKAAALKNLEEYRYRNKEWFFWGGAADGDRHLRLKHEQPINLRKIFSADGNNYKFHFVNTDVAPNAGAILSREEYDAWKGRFECGELRYEDYVKVFTGWEMFSGGHHIERAHNAFRISQCWCRNQNEGERVRKDEYNLFKTLEGRDQDLYNKAKNLIEDCSRELDNAVGGGGGGGAGDMKQLIDFGGLDDLIMKDPKKAVEILDKKLQELKNKVFPAIKKVDAAEKRLRDLDGQLKNTKSVVWFNRRHSMIRAFAFAIMKAWRATDRNMNPDVTFEWVKKFGCADSDLVEVLNDMQGFFGEYHRALEDYYNAQIELGKALNCKAAKEAEKKRDDPKPLPDPGGHPDRPKPSSAKSGSDQDNGGDYWRLTEDGWKQYNGELDI